MKKQPLPNEMLRKERLRRGWSQQEMADRLETTVVTVHRWEQGIQQPRAYFRARIATLLEKSEQELGLFEQRKPVDIPQEGHQKQHELPFSQSVTQDHQIPLDQQVSHPFLLQNLPPSKRLGLFLIIPLLVIICSLLYLYPPTTSNPQHLEASTPSLLPAQASSGATLVIDDSLRNQSIDGAWDTGQNCHFNQEAYQITSIGTNYCSANKRPFSTFIYQIDIVLLRGSRAGIIFRADDQSDMYYFSLNASGQYELDMIGSSNENLLSGKSAFIVQGYNRKNHLQVEAHGAQISVWVNGHLLGNKQDTTYTTGYIGVCVGDYANSSDPTVTTALFQDAHVWIF
jgi:transcriptional regulator with XRE-family HTH domain